MTEHDVQTFTVGEGDDLITYDVRGDLSSGRPLFVFGSPMEARCFATLAELLPGPAGRHLRPARHRAQPDRHRRRSRRSSTPRTCTG